MTAHKRYKIQRKVSYVYTLNNDVLGCFPKVRTGRPDHGRTSHFKNEIGFYQKFLLKNHVLRAYYLGFD